LDTPSRRASWRGRYGNYFLEDVISLTQPGERSDLALRPGH
jgi:hypothetical protein